MAKQEVDLESASGLPIALRSDGSLGFGAGLPDVKPVPRTLEELRDVLWNQTASEPQVVYLMYRSVGREREVIALVEEGLRYDLTVIRAGAVGGEYPKTYGHYHPKSASGPHSYPEIYEVIHGVAHIILQGPMDDVKALDDVTVVEANPGDKVVIPPGYGHVTVNPGRVHLVLANVVAQFDSDYGRFREMKGAAYYELALREPPVAWVANDRYGEVPRLRFLEANRLETPEKAGGSQRNPFISCGDSKSEGVPVAVTSGGS